MSRYDTEIRLLVALWLLTVLLLTAGCAHRSPVMEMMPPETLDTGSISMTVSAPQIRNVAVSVKNRCETDSEKVIAEHLEGRINEELSGQGFVTGSVEPDFEIDFSISASQYDRFGDFLIYDAAVETAVTASPSMTRLASKTFTARSDRKPGRIAALKDAAFKLAAPVCDWVKQTMTPYKIHTSTCNVTIALPERSESTAAELAGDMAGTISAIAGVNRCDVVQTAERSVTFSVDYSTEAFPEGLDIRLENMPQPEVKPLHRANVTVTLPDKYRSSVPEYTILFVETVGGLTGIESCRSLSTGPETRAIQFEVIFDPETFPEGLYNRIASIEKLDIDVQ